MKSLFSNHKSKLFFGIMISLAVALFVNDEAVFAQSTSATVTILEPEYTSANVNLLDNPYSLSSWNIIRNGGYGWLDYSTAQSTGKSNWVHDQTQFSTSYNWAKKSQTVPVPSDLLESMSGGDDVTITVTEQYSKTFCGEKTGRYKNSPPYDRYYLEISLLDDSKNVLEKKSTGIIQMKESCAWSRNWQTAQLEFRSDEITSDVESIRVEHGGISGEWWRGHYGPAMKGISLEWSKQ